MTGTLAAIAVLLLVSFVFDAAVRANRRRLRQTGRLPPEGAGTDADVERLVRLGHKIEAIKLYREIHRLDLKAAKDAVDALCDRLEREGRAPS